MPQNQPLAEARAGNFLLTVGGKRNISAVIQSTNAADMTLGTTMYPTGEKDLFLPSNKMDTDPLVFTYIISEDYNEWLSFFKWMMTCKNMDNPEEFYEACEITTLDANNKPGIRFLYTDCFPFVMEGMQYSIDAEQNEVVISSVSMRYNTFKVVDKNGNEFAEDYVQQ